jgi:hypothetical protein
MFSISTFAQDDFTRNYKKIVIKTEKDTIERTGSVTVVFKTNEVVIYDGKIVDHYYQISDVEEGASESGYKYQIIKCILKESSKTVNMQLFDSVDTLRVIFADGYVEFYN